MFESVNARTHARTPARLPSYKLTLRACGSGELISYLFCTQEKPRIDYAITLRVRKSPKANTHAALFVCYGHVSLFFTLIGPV